MFYRSLVFGAAAAVLAAPASAVPVLDQQFDPLGVATFSAGIYATLSRAQTFTAGLTGTLTGVSIMLNEQTALGGLFTLSILNAVGGRPVGSGATLFSQSYEVAGLPYGPWNFDDRFFDLSSAAISVVAGTQYALAVTYAGVNGAPTGPGIWLLWDASNRSNYERGALFQGDGDLVTTWAVDSLEIGYDVSFKTYVDTARSTVPEPATGWLAMLALAALTGVTIGRRR